MQFFTITKQHLKLLRRFEVGWQDCETGAPEIDPKRPYGNSYVPGDIHEILKGETVGLTTSKRDALTDKEEAAYLKLHREMDKVLQIVLATGSFRAGKYVANRYVNNWKLCP